MEQLVFETKEQMGQAAAASASEEIKRAVKLKGQADIILATGTSQFETLKALVECQGIDWSKVVMFHLDEYIGLSQDYAASFRKYLRERFVAKVRVLNKVHFIAGDAADPVAECKRLGRIIVGRSIDVALVGIGENGHLAFNDPPADFETEESFIIVTLDEQCRRQQLNEGWFETLEDVPTQAISMSIRQIMQSSCIIVSVPEKRKAHAVKAALEGPVTDLCPASILQTHPDCKMFLDGPAASLLGK
ncbi:MAG: glucosamine-6-phosphate deaminase [Planctomycetota bacterium]|jgi:glucosamine-6-phosphate deaminase